MNRRFRGFFLLCPLLLAAAAPAGAQQTELGITPEDMRTEQRADGGFHLYIRKKPGIGSVLLTESTKDPAMVLDNYAYRAPEWNAVNGDEIRILDGRPIPKSDEIWSLVDSTPENHPELGAAFHIYIPYILNFGYLNTRHGEVYITDGTFLNIRTFSLPYADYRGRFRDNPFTLSVTQQPLPGPPEDNYMKETVTAFAEIAKDGMLVYSTGPSDLVDKIREVLLPERGKSLDLVLCLDTTGSMKDDIDAVRSSLIPMLKDMLPAFSSFRIGMVLYKDYNDEYLTRRIAFTGDFSRFQTALNGIRVRGGRDIPEAVYEALYAGTSFPWEAESRLIILIGDAPPHLRQRGTVSKEMVETAAAEKGLKIHAIILPQ
ncbi:MAG: VWA domain-containing protein [Treponema sp.]|nr:VWA domain-containing protein [Treponema sp.]